jgi:hypothetical protein
MRFRIVLLLAFVLAWALAGSASAQPKPPSATPPAEPVAEPARTAADYALPLEEIIGFDFLLNRFNRNFGSDKHDYAVSLESIRHNLHSSWGVDSDPFRTNQLGHPYQGSMYHGFARSAGFDFWPSMGYTFAGSALWEIAGENTPPSRNDQIASGIGGSFLGESLFRMSSLLLEKGGGLPPFWREVAAAAISPSTGYNRLVMGKRLDAIFASRNPEYYSQAQVGVMGATDDNRGSRTGLKRYEAQTDFSLDYGLPGKDGYQYTRPFDYFSFTATVSSADLFENVMTRGLLLGKDYQAGKNYRGIWGLYGSYDFISPQTFRISTTAVSLGTTGQWRASDSIVVQGTGSAGLGYAAVGAVGGSTDRDYHYGVAPQALLALRVIFGDRSSLDLTAREYFVSRVGGTGRGGHDNIARADISYTWRIQKQHAITVKYLWNRRDATFPDLSDRSQTRSTIGIFYTLLGQDHFGRVDWK